MHCLQKTVYFLTRWHCDRMPLDWLLLSFPRPGITSASYRKKSRWTKERWRLLVLLAGLSKKITSFQRPLQVANTHEGTFGGEAKQMPGKFISINHYQHVATAAARWPYKQWRTEGVVWGVQTPHRNSVILTKYQKLRKFYYMKWNFLYQITAASRTPD
jgi:hypothetical protein